MKKRISIFALCFVLMCSCFMLSACNFFENTFGTNKKSGEILPHLIDQSQAETAPARPINDSLTLTEPLRGEGEVSQQLYEMEDALRRGYRPTFEDANPIVKQVYDKAIEINNRYIKNDFSTFDKIHAIHDYLTYFIKYDQVLFDLEQSGEATDIENPSFYANGALLQNTAVCDGLTRAFTLLCLIEKIDCYRVTGTFEAKPGIDINHAWNNVKLEGVWYNVDITMDSWNVEIGANATAVKIINHGYMLISDDKMKGGIGKHIFSETDNIKYACERNYDLSTKNVVTKIKNQQQLNEYFKSIKDKKKAVGKIEIQLEFDGYNKDDLDLPNAYSAELNIAYKSIKNSDFGFNTNSGTYPYQRYPNGIFLCLIYK